MTRYNIFNQIHKGLRALLYETSLQLQQTDFTNTDEAEAATQKVELVLDLFDAHAYTEDTFILPELQQYEPSVVDVFEKEHQKDLMLSNQLSEWLKAFGYAIAPGAKKDIGKAITIAFIDFMIFNLEHMKKEEDVLNKLLWNYYTDPQLKAITQAILAHVPADKMPQYSKWMMRGLANDEIIGWLKEVKNNAPDFVFQSLMGLSSAELSEQRWQQVQEQLTEGAMLA